MYPNTLTSHRSSSSHIPNIQRCSTPVYSTGCSDTPLLSGMKTGIVGSKMNSESYASLNNIEHLGIPLNMFVLSKGYNSPCISPHVEVYEKNAYNATPNQFSGRGLRESTPSTDSGIVISRSSTSSSNKSEENLKNFIYNSTPKLEVRTGVKRQLDLPVESPNYTTSPYQARKRIPSRDIRQNSFPHSSHSPLIPRSHSLTNGGDWDKISKAIWDEYLQNKQADNIYKQKMTLRDALFNILLDHFPYCGLYVVGSSMSGLGANNSDMDMCLMLTHSEIDQEKEAKGILKHIYKVVTQCSFVRDPQLIFAKVPILKFTDSISGVEVDLNINNAVGIRNTQLLNSYSRIDWRVRPLVLIIKTWARRHCINDAKNMTLSSYSLVLMIIHYLQCGCNPPVLPCLHKLQCDKFQPNSDVRQLKLLEELPPFESKNTQTLGELLVGFLDYYTNKFDFSENAISVRLGATLPKISAANYKSIKNKSGQWKFISIEEPFERTNTARSVYNKSAFFRILEAFRNSWCKLKDSKSLYSILRI